MSWSYLCPSLSVQRIQQIPHLDVRFQMLQYWKLNILCKDLIHLEMPSVLVILKILRSISSWTDTYHTVEPAQSVNIFGLHVDCLLHMIYAIHTYIHVYIWFCNIYIYNLYWCTFVLVIYDMWCKYRSSIHSCAHMHTDTEKDLWQFTIYSIISIDIVNTLFQP